MNAHEKSRRLCLEVLSNEDCEQIVEAVLEVLENTGCDMKHEGVRKLFADAGCEVDGSIARIPKQLMRDAIASAPSEVQLYDREGNPAALLSAHSDATYHIPGISALNRIDIDTGEKHRTTKLDCEQAGIVEDNLANIDIACSMTAIADGAYQELTEVYETQIMLKSTSKPFMMNTFSPAAFDIEMEMLAAVAGSKEAVSAKPFVIPGQCALSPLGHDKNSMDVLIKCFEAGLPAYYIGAPSMGGTGPASYAGSYVVTLADTFVGLLLSQLVNKGTPFVASAFVDVMDMKSMQFTFSAPEFLMNSMATAQIFRYLDLPYLVHLGATDSPVFDQQAAFDAGVGLFAAALVGANATWFLGYLESAMSSSLEGLVYADEVISYLDGATRPIEVSEEMLSLEDIDDEGPGGNFLATDLTLEMSRSLWAPSVFTRANYDAYVSGGKKDLGARLNDRVHELLAKGPRVPLPADVAEAIDAIVAAAEAARR